MTFKRCFWLLVSLLIIAIILGTISGNSMFYCAIAVVITWLLVTWFVLALFRGSEEPKPNGVEDIKSKPE